MIFFLFVVSVSIGPGDAMINPLPALAQFHDSFLRPLLNQQPQLELQSPRSLSGDNLCREWNYPNSNTWNVDEDCCTKLELAGCPDGYRVDMTHEVCYQDGCGTGYKFSCVPHEDPNYSTTNSTPTTRWCDGDRLRPCTSPGDDCIASDEWGEPMTCAEGWSVQEVTSCDYVCCHPDHGCYTNDERVSSFGDRDQIEPDHLPYTHCGSHYANGSFWVLAVLYLGGILAYLYKEIFYGVHPKPPPGPNQPSPPTPALPNVDTASLTGLRGLVSLHIAVGHYFAFSESTRTDLLGGASMGFFYLLSGFVMTLGTAKSGVLFDPSAPKFNRLKFLRKRAARLLPTYFLTNFLMALGMASSPDVEVRTTWVVLTALGLNMWLVPFAYWWPVLFPEEPNLRWNATRETLPINGVTWTIQTMFAFYIVFPYCIQYLRDMDRPQRRHKIASLYYASLAFYFFGFWFAGLTASKGAHEMIGHKMYWTSRGWPPGRVPVFLMGCVGAMERLDVRNEQDKMTEASYFGGCCKSFLCLDPYLSAKVFTKKDWGDAATKSFLTYGVMLSLAILCNITKSGWENFGLLFRILYEMCLPNVFLHLILALSRCEEQGLVASLCRGQALQFMGNISMSFYMIHMMVFITFSFVMGMGSAAIPTSLFVSVILGYILTEYFEKPVETLIRGEKRVIRGVEGTSAPTNHTEMVQMAPSEYAGYAQAATTLPQATIPMGFYAPIGQTDQKVTPTGQQMEY